MMTNQIQAKVTQMDSMPSVAKKYFGRMATHATSALELSHCPNMGVAQAALEVLRGTSNSGHFAVVLCPTFSDVSQALYQLRQNLPGGYFTEIVRTGGAKDTSGVLFVRTNTHKTFLQAKGILSNLGLKVPDDAHDSFSHISLAPRAAAVAAG